MAKSGRASVTKRNRAKLRATVFGPAVDARTERLSAKLQELASQPLERDLEKSMELDATKSDTQNKSTDTKASESSENMDIDKGPVTTTGSRSKKSGRIYKRTKKASASIVFRPHPSKLKNKKK